MKNINVNWLYLVCAVMCEVAGSMALKQAEQDKLWFLLTLVADGVAFALLGVLLRRGMGLSVVYGLWGAMGVALTAALGTLLFNEPFTWVMGLGVALVMAGVLLVEYGADAHGVAVDEIPGARAPEVGASTPRTRTTSQRQGPS